MSLPHPLSPSPQSGEGFTLKGFTLKGFTLKGKQGERSWIRLFFSEHRSFGRGIMGQEINQPIDVIAVFQKGSMVPVRFRWNGKVAKIVRVTGRWKTSERKFKIKHFAIIDKNSQFCRLSY